MTQSCRHLLWRAIGIILAVSAPGRTVAAQVPPSYVVVFDRDMTPVSGTTDLLTIERVLAAIEDRWLPPALFDESTPRTHALGIGYRLGKWLALDLPQDQFLMVVGHEVFGHGARLREVGAEPITYRFDAPIPYGPGGASTMFSGDVPLTRSDTLGIDAAGIEAQNVLADLIGEQALATGSIAYRDAWLYLQSRLAGLGYIRSVSPDSPPGHDVKDFLDDFNQQCDPPRCTPLTGPTLKRRALLMLADPMLAYAGYAWAVSYVVHGVASTPIPMIPLPGGVQYLPALRFDMTPYGTAVTTEHAFVRGGQVTNVSVGVGDTGRRHAWEVGLFTTDLLHATWVRAGLRADLWRQPTLDAPPNAQTFMTGGLLATALAIPFRREGRAERVAALVEGGYKADGFVPGERLHHGPIVRIGVIVRR